MWVTLLFLLAALSAAFLLFIMVYYVIMFSDLEMDYVNPIELCRRLNVLVVPEMLLHAVLTVLFLPSLQLLSLTVNIPLVAYHFLRWRENRHYFEATDIFRHLPYRKREAMIKLGFFLLSFFYYLFRMVSTLIYTRDYGRQPYGFQ